MIIKNDTSCDVITTSSPAVFSVGDDGGNASPARARLLYDNGARRRHHDARQCAPASAKRPQQFVLEDAEWRYPTVMTSSPRSVRRPSVSSVDSYQSSFSEESRGEKHECVYCGITYDKPSSLEAHIRHYCDYTSLDLKRFTTTAASYAHAQTSTDRPPAALTSSFKSADTNHKQNSLPDPSSDVGDRFDDNFDEGRSFSPISDTSTSPPLSLCSETSTSPPLSLCSETSTSPPLSPCSETSTSPPLSLCSETSSLTFVGKESPPLTGAFRCYVCSYSADKRHRLIQHMATMHSDDDDNTSREDASRDDTRDDAVVPRSDDSVNTPTHNKADAEMEVDVESERDVSEPANRCARPPAWHCQECDIKFSSPSNFKAHKDFYCGRNGRKVAEACRTSPGAHRQPARTGNATNSLHPEQLLSQQMLTSLLPLTAAQGMFVPMLVPTPFGMSYAMLPIPALKPPTLKHPVLPEAPAAVTEQHTKVKDEKAEDQPLDLRCRKDVPAADDLEPEAPRAKVRRQSPEPGEIIRPVPVQDDMLTKALPNLHMNIVKEMSRKHPLLMHAKSGADVNRCEDCNIVFYKPENYKVHKEMYCAGRRGKDTADEATEKSAMVVAQPARAMTSPARSPAEVVRDATTPEEYTMQYVCVPCNIKFSNPDTLQAHQQYYCPAGKALTQQLALNSAGVQTPTVQHQQQRSPKTPPRRKLEDVTCTKCAQCFRTAEELLHHSCTHTTMKIPVFCCPYCNYVAQSDSRLLDHIKAHAPTKAYRCELCGYRGNTVRGMRMHGKTHIDAGQLFTDDHMIEYHEPPLIPKRLRTVTENIAVNVTSDLLRADVGNIHQRKRTLSRCSSSSGGGGDGSATKSNVIEQIINRSMQNSCMICHMMFADYDALQKHMTLHVMEELNIRQQLDSKSTSTDSKKSTDYNIDTILGTTTTKANSADVKHDVTVKEECKVESSSRDDKALIDNDDGDAMNKRRTSLSPKNDASPLKIETCNDATDDRKENVNYCQQCDISFVYLATYIAHKKHYCSSHAAERLQQAPAASTDV